MTQNKPQISSLQPNVLPDNRRVTFELVVSNLPPAINAFFAMPDIDEPSPASQADAPSPYPNVELSILNSRRQQIASLYIVEHTEEFTALTLHISTPNPQEQYLARAEMTYRDEIIDWVEIPFTLLAGE